MFPDIAGLRRNLFRKATGRHPKNLRAHPSSKTDALSVRGKSVNPISAIGILNYKQHACNYKRLQGGLSIAKARVFAFLLRGRRSRSARFAAGALGSVQLFGRGVLPRLFFSNGRPQNRSAARGLLPPANRGAARGFCRRARVQAGAPFCARRYAKAVNKKRRGRVYAGRGKWYKVKVWRLVGKQRAAGHCALRALSAARGESAAAVGGATAKNRAHRKRRGRRTQNRAAHRLPPWNCAAPHFCLFVRNFANRRRKKFRRYRFTAQTAETRRTERERERRQKRRTERRESAAPRRTERERERRTAANRAANRA